MSTELVRIIVIRFLVVEEFVTIDRDRCCD